MTSAKFFGALRSFLAKHLPRTFDWASQLWGMSVADKQLVGAYLCLAACVSFVIQKILEREIVVMFPDWTVGFADEARAYNAHFINYVLLVFIGLGFFCGRAILSQSEWLKRALLKITDHSRLFFAVASFMLVGGSFNYFVIIWGGLSLFFLAPSVFDYVRDLKQSRAGDSEKAARRFPWPILVVLALGSVFAAGCMVKAWYPVRMTNDYIEFPDTIRFDNEGRGPIGEEFTQISRPDYISCEKGVEQRVTLLGYGEKHESLSAGRFDETPSQKAMAELDASIVQAAMSNFLAAYHCPVDLHLHTVKSLHAAIEKTGIWESQSGRLFYHHSYLVVPAVHFLRYGFDTPIPALYGVGNTLFHTLLLKLTSPTLTSYFNTYPIAQGVGVLVIGLAMFYISGSAAVFFLSMLFCMASLMAMGFEDVFLAPGFNPLRYAGLCLQMSSIFFAFRQRSPAVGCLGLYLAALVSVVWNTEFAVLGLVGQAMVFVTGTLPFSLPKRMTLCVGLIILAGCMARAIAGLSSGFLHTIQVGLFGIGMPQMPGLSFLWLFLAIVSLLIAGHWCAKTFHQHNENLARLILLPMAALIMMKYIYNPRLPHLVYCGVLLMPLSLVYLDWRPVRPAATGHVAYFYRLRSLVALLAIVPCLALSFRYVQLSKDWHAVMTQPFVNQAWSGLGEDFLTTTPADPIVQRVDAVRSQMKETDRVLFLSPVDHLLSFYLNPAHYCGHFEILTNLVTRKNVSSVINCALTDPNALVVYDDAVETLRPPVWDLNVYDLSGIEAKHKQLYTMYKVMGHLRPAMVLVKKIGPLSFYRHAVPQTVAGPGKK